MHPTTKSFLLLASTVFVLSASGCVDLTPCERGTEGCACLESDTEPACEPVGDGTAICAAGTCVVQRGTSDDIVCYDACAYRTDGFCDDGGEGSSADVFCRYGSDCGDCGPRENPCAGTASPVFCPQTPDNCWPANTDCFTVRYCPMRAVGMQGPYGCTTGQAVDCDLPGPLLCATPPSTCSASSPTICIGESACIGAFIDCNSLTSCNSQTVACYTGETVNCSASGAACTPDPSLMTP